MNLIKKATMATVLAATALTSISPAAARDYRRHRGGDDTAAVAVGVGILGIALGALVASSANKRNNDRDWEYRRRNMEWRDGYYWDRDGYRYDRDGRRYDGGDYYARRGYDDRGYGYDRGYRGY